MNRILRNSLTLLALFLGAALLCLQPDNWLGIYVILFAALNSLPRQSHCLGAPTLTVSEILSDILKAFTQRVPALSFFATDYSMDQVKFNQQIIAHLPIVPVAYDHNAATGYSTNAQNARDLLVDVPITIDGWKDVPIKIAVTDAAQDRSKNYLKTIGNAGYVLGKAVCDYALTKAVAANFSEKTIEAAANVSKDTLGRVRKAMNVKKAGTPRYMLTDSDFFNALDNDPRISSGDYYGQRIEGDPYGRLVNCAGFAEILEYPDFPANAETLQALGFDQRAIGVATRLPMDSTDLAQQLGLPVTYKREVVKDPQTGLAIAGFGWIDQDTHDIFITSTVMFGAVAGSQGGAAGTKCDYAGHRVVEGP